MADLYLLTLSPKNEFLSLGRLADNEGAPLDAGETEDLEAAFALAQELVAVGKAHRIMLFACLADLKERKP